MLLNYLDLFVGGGVKIDVTIGGFLGSLEAWWRCAFFFLKNHEKSTSMFSFGEITFMILKY